MQMETEKHKSLKMNFKEFFTHIFNILFDTGFNYHSKRIRGILRVLEANIG